MVKRFDARELEFLTRLRELSRSARTTLKRLHQDGYVTREAAAFVAMSLDDALLVAASADHKTDGFPTCSEEERRQHLLSGLLKP